MLHSNSTHSHFFIFFNGWWWVGGAIPSNFLCLFSSSMPWKTGTPATLPFHPHTPPTLPPPYPLNPSTPTAWVPASIYFGSLPSRGWEKRQVLADADDSLQVSEHCICLWGSALSLSLSVPEDTLTLPSFCLFCSSLLPPPPQPPTISPFLDWT